MDYHVLYPGSFCPPTYGHLDIVAQAAAIFPEITIVCSSNPGKNLRWFTEDECKKMWQAYSLPRGVKVLTLEEAYALELPAEQILMIRGLRGQADLESENDVMLYNLEKYGINKYLYFFSTLGYHCSSSLVRQMAMDRKIEKLCNYVAPQVISKLLEKVYRVKNIFMVVGRPAAGKSTFLRALSEISAGNIHIDTDCFSQQLEPKLKIAFPGRDLIDVACKNDAELSRLIGKDWLELLKMELSRAEGSSNVFIEVPYGLKPNKKMFRFCGGKVIYIGCENRDKLVQRNSQRETSALGRFIDSIPDLAGSRRIAKTDLLELIEIDTDCGLPDIIGKARSFHKTLAKETGRKGGIEHARPEKTWQSLCREIGCGRMADEAYGYVSMMYSIPERFYHTLDFHIAKCVEEIMSVVSLAENPPALVYAGILHDIYLNFINSAMDEKNSAECAYLLARRLGLTEEFAAYAAKLIQTGTSHNRDLAEVNIDGRILNNADLAILGKPQNEYDLYEYLITREYTRFFAYEKFRIGRIAVLEKFLKRREIYSLPVFRDKYEEQARENLERSVWKLKNGD